MKPRLPIEDGKVFGSLTVVRFLGGRKTTRNPVSHYLTQCKCGSEHIVSGHRLRSGKATRCRKCWSKAAGRAHVKNETEKRYGRWLVVREAPQELRRGAQIYWECLCDCGKTAVVDGASLRGGHSESCGCLKADATRERTTTHGGSSTPEYRAWVSMRKRCSPSATGNHRKRYYERGIRVCPEWNTLDGGFEKFIAYVGQRPADKTSIGRKDNDGNYEPGNVEWEDARQQANNRTSSVLLTYQGETATAAEWGERVGIDPVVIRSRVLDGWSHKSAITIPVIDAANRLFVKKDADGNVTVGKPKKKEPVCPATCLICGKSFPKSRSKKTCSPACSRKRKNELKRLRRGSLPSANCVICGDSFPRKSPGHLTCKPACSRERRLQRDNPGRFSSVNCVICGGHFVRKSSGHLTCKPACSDERRRRQQTDRRRERMSDPAVRKRHNEKARRRRREASKK